jgi:hypothetical protein
VDSTFEILALSLVAGLAIPTGGLLARIDDIQPGDEGDRSQLGDISQPHASGQRAHADTDSMINVNE